MTASLSRLPGTAVWTIDPAHTLVGFSARHMMITTVRGRFSDVRGALALDDADGARSAVAVDITAASIDTGNAQRDEHLRSSDFLDAAAHPALTFRSTRIEGDPLAERTPFRVVGELTIRGVTREVVLDARLTGRGRDPWGAEKVSFTATTRIDRRDYGLTWNAALETGGVLVSNEIGIELEVQAARAAAD